MSAAYTNRQAKERESYSRSLFYSADPHKTHLSDEEDSITSIKSKETVQTSVLKSLLDALEELEKTIEDELQKILSRYGELEKRVNRLNAIDLLPKTLR